MAPPPLSDLLDWRVPYVPVLAMICVSLAYACDALLDGLRAPPLTGGALAGGDRERRHADGEHDGAGREPDALATETGHGSSLSVGSCPQTTTFGPPGRGAGRV